MMKLIIVTPTGTVFDGEVDYVVAEGIDGQVGILKDHIPIVVPIRRGFVKSVIENLETFYAISGGILEQSNNVATVIAQEVANGKTLEEATTELEHQRKLQQEENRQALMDFAELERELALNLKEIKASRL